jgi:hypothetical protein
MNHTTDNLRAIVLPRVLRLTLKKRWFDMIASGEKKEEYREIKDWIISRLHGKSYDVVEFSNGYGAHVPKITVEYLGWGNGIGRAEWGATPMKPTIIIRLGRVLSRTNDQTLATGGAATRSTEANQPKNED